MEITIGHLYPDLLNLYGDRGNIMALVRRLEWRGIGAKIREYRLHDDIDFAALDIVFLGGGSDREQMLVCARLREIRSAFADYVESDGAVIAICGGYQLLGEYYRMGDAVIEGLRILDVRTENEPGRLIGNVVIRSPLSSMPIVGFENHGGRTYIGEHTPLGRVITGGGNNGKDGHEGVQYKNVLGTYLHGPLLPKNPELCDWILRAALLRKGYTSELAPLDDTMEITANRAVAERFAGKMAKRP
ncbi:MAG: glutamine amidotransferase [Spirochaetota bacterium]|jgi:CobQ-like glutamine amidotransferase family enzyme|nr:glutamine amidotransferase [Spirochaetota bacterium]